MNPFIKILYDEHAIIVNAIDVAKELKSLIGKDDSLYETSLRKLITFFRNYADKFHHYKEEIILFPEMCKRNELLQDGIIQEMFENHEEFRDRIKQIEKYLDEKNYPAAHAELEKYANGLLDHIAVENDEVFQIAEVVLTDEDLERIGYRFVDCDKELGEKLKEELVEITTDLKRQIMLMD